MKDEEMAEEYANEKCKDCYMCSYSEHKNPYKICQRRKDRKQAFLAGLKGPQRHDLRKDPNDLPKELHDVLCLVIHNEHRYVLQGYLRDGRWVLSSLGTYLKNDDVVAWCENSLFKEIKEN